MSPEEVSAELLQDFKARMRITHDTEDGNLRWLLSSSYAAVKATCGDFDIATNQEGKELVFERARYAYNDSVEFFEVNFMRRLHAFGISLVVLEDETV
ncbi:phage gp6-like head-tail connector protein [Salinicoccus roseus]|uniref:phage gp6-like head-tail connector protein n=1 Tax=Salinicoccus roseus TaxID=45670 RepID=UPI002300D8C2|nr:phage gp6-like head-tail connector protein [Salinicoccus roseus]